MVIFDYQEKEKKRIKELDKILEIKTLKDYTKNRPLFYAKPNFNLKLITNMESFSNYEITINDKNYKIEKNEFEVNLEEGISTIIVKFINKYGISGFANITKIKYQ